MYTPKILVLYCGAGGSTRGYQMAGFHVTGVDINPQPDYCGDVFIMGDAIAYAMHMGGAYDAISAHPPCQRYSTLTTGTNRVTGAGRGDAHPDLIVPTRDALMATGRPWVMENVPGAPVRHDLKLCGETFGLGVLQERYVELYGVKVPQQFHKPHRGRVRGWRHGEYFDGPYIAAYGEGGGKGSVDEIREAKRIYWTRDLRALCNAIPPAYTEYIGTWLLQSLG